MKKTVRQQRIVQLAAITAASEADGIECTVLHIARQMGLKKTPHVYSIVRSAQQNGVIKVIAHKGQNDADQFLIVSTDHPIYQGMDEMIKAYRKEVYS